MASLPLLFLLSLACSGGESVSAPPTTAQVDVAATGSKFEPPVEVASIPDGAWMCDMGTVHYAAHEKGDGECPVCGMALTQKGAAAQ